MAYFLYFFLKKSNTAPCILANGSDFLLSGPHAIVLLNCLSKNQQESWIPESSDFRIQPSPKEMDQCQLWKTHISSSLQYQSLKILQTMRWHNSEISWPFELSKQETATIFLISFRTFNPKRSMAKNFKVDDFFRGRHEVFGVCGGFLMGTLYHAKHTIRHGVVEK